PSTVTNVENMKVTTTVTNTGDTTLTLLTDPKSPLSSLAADTFKIVDSTGATPDFTGIVAKYVHSAVIADGKGASSVLSPGQSVEVEHDLSEAYSFNREGKYFITPNNLFHAVNSSKLSVPIHATVGTHTTSLTGKLAEVRHLRQPRPSYVNCTRSQQSSLIRATESAANYALEAYTYLKDHCFATPRYVTWFGAYDSVRHGIVKDIYKNISSAPSFSSFTYDCSCTTPGTWGYVKPNEFGVIYLCPVFWTLPLHGKESMAGSLVQKSSHFIRNGGALDYVYAQPPCKELAITNPNKAIYNADSYEYFAENDPAS
ncbi:hypothetical protein C0991_001004, partial [Blastosporella zonata]